jgi:2-keto-4-pentenoate hydratase/2-oxohepta-3-ene-1,7-dioic acid hydratase in catechol pathway
MRVYSLSRHDEDFLGFDDDGDIIDLTKAIAFYEVTKNKYFPDSYIYIEELIWDNRFSVDFLGEVMSVIAKYGVKDHFKLKGQYTINAPVNPGKIIALGNNYHEHIKELNGTVPDNPVLFGKWPSTVIGHQDSIVKPSWIGRMDYEAELALIIGRTAKNVKASQAMKYVAGYTCLNDVTARDIQKNDLSRSLPWMQSKNFDTFTPIGPCVLLSGMVKEPVSIGVQSTVNGELRQNGNTSDFIFDIPTIIEYISKIMTLDAGDIITTGTPVGVGPLNPGDTVEITCEDIGTLSNTVISSKK